MINMSEVEREEYSLIRLRKSTIEKLKREIQFKGETYDDIINRLLEKRGRKAKSSV
jgi:hypothetical protein